MKKRVGKHGIAWLVAVGILTVGLSMPLSYWHSGTEQKEPAQLDTEEQNPDKLFRSRSTHNGVVIANDENSREIAWTTEREDSASTERPPKRSFGVFRPEKRERNDSFIVHDKSYPLRSYRMMTMPNDPLANQWWVTNANLPAAWDFPDGQYRPILAVIDTGFALNHEEFANRWFTNTGESGPAEQEGPSRLNCSDRGLPVDYSCNLVDDDVDGIVDNETGTAPYENPSALNCTARALALDKSCNQLDDDANGYIDDHRGWDVINQDNSAQAGQLSPGGTGTEHGSMVAGAAAANGNNGRGIAGVNWQAKILPIQALDDDGYGDTRSVGEAIRYAVSQKADVINISLGTEYHDEYVREAIELATSAGIVVVASSGNDGCDCVVYPARYAEVIAVGAIDANGAKATFSSYGTAVDLVAPGTGFTLPSWSQTNGTARYVSNVAGTSFSAPMVAGLVALMKSSQPTALPLQLISALRQTVDKSLVTPQQRSDFYGYGRLDGHAVRNRMIDAQHTQQSYVFTPVASGGYLRQNTYEAKGSYSITECQTQKTGLPIYEMRSASDSFFSISEVETRRASLLGYNVSLFSYACLAQPHDTVDFVRSIDLYREFRNVHRKY